MGLSARTGNRQGGGGDIKRALVAGLLSVSFVIFVAGSFVFAYMYIFAASSSSGDSPRSSLPVISVIPPLLTNPSSPPAESTPTSLQGVQAKGRTTFLLLGVDQRDDEKGVPTRSDTMMVLTVDEKNKRAAMISLPRDMWVEIPGFADNRINVANFLGDAMNYPGGGAALAKKTVEHNFGVKIDYIARVDFRGFEKIVDTLGGVTVNVERAIRDDEYPTEDYGTMSIFIPAGVQNMNGKVALQYARSRHSENDFGRAKRQQKLLLAIKEKAMALNVIPKLPSLVGTLFDMVYTDLPPQEFLRLAVIAKDLDTGNVGSLVIDEKLAPPFKGEGGADLLMPNRQAIKKAIGTLLADPVILEEAAAVEVYNGTLKELLATNTGEYLSAQGFDVVKVGGASRTDYKTTQILVYGDKKETASLLADALRVNKKAIVTQPPAAGSSGPDIQVILGADFTPLR